MVDEFLNLFRLSGIQINFGEGHIGVPDVAAKLDGTLQDLSGTFVLTVTVMVQIASPHAEIADQKKIILIIFGQLREISGSVGELDIGIAHAGQVDDLGGEDAAYLILTIFFLALCRIGERKLILGDRDIVKTTDIFPADKISFALLFPVVGIPFGVIILTTFGLDVQPYNE